MIISGISENRIAPFSANLPGQELIIAASPARAARIASDLSFFASKPVFLLPDALNEGFKYEAKSKENLYERITILSHAVNGEDIIVVAPVLSALQSLPDISLFKDKILRFNLKTSIDRSVLIEKLVCMGYSREEMCEAPGQFSVRGDIADIFAAGSEYPVRIEFFDTDIDSIRVYDPFTQRSLKNIEEFTVFPSDISGEGCHIWDYFNNDKLLLVDDPDRMDEFSLLPEADYLFYPLRVKGVDRYIESKAAPVYGGHMQVFADDLKSFLKKNYTVTIACSTAERLTNLKDFIDSAGIEGVILKDGTLVSGTEFPEEKKLYLSDAEIFPYTKRKRKKYAGSNSQQIRTFTDINKGDYVVHESHGVGKFTGVQKMSVQGSVKDYLKIEYAAGDILYVPVDQMGALQKYVGSEGLTPKVNRLSGGDWNKTKERVKAAVRDMAEEFLKAAAERKATPGYKFKEDSIWQKEFEDAFPYEETGDQLKAAAEIKADMQSDVAMDRLLCGDVGYGKTEVAARAVFKCLEEGKQAAVLVPTTILANQHYHTFINRLSGYPFNIDMLCRFRTPAQQNAVIEKVKKGEIDLLIGTHRLLSSDVIFKDLGLLVIDEEQRFGVEHKEKIKKLKQNVDVLTLSATPIPRTLHMSLTGIRNMSVIAEPPGDRFPVQTYVMEENDIEIAGAIKRELARGGQVFVVYNRVRGIKTVAEKISDLVPECSVAVAHGQMGESALEDIMMDFTDGKYDVLVATTIIESGLDIPNVNTMIILDADKLGLSQLYQLRGRVGRTNRIAYAFLFYRRDKQISEIAEKRLKAIKEFTEFGSGFRVAMRDLEIRGAGNVLGVEQSGHMVSVGYELYCKLIDEAVREIQAQQSGIEYVPSVQSDTEVSLAVEAYIPEDYIQDEMLRLDMYKRISSAADYDDRIEIVDELLDRFGDIPWQTTNLIDISIIHNQAGKLGISKVVVQRGSLIFTFEENNSLTPERIGKLLDTYGMRLDIMASKEPRIVLLLKGVPAIEESLNVLSMML